MWREETETHIFRESAHHGARTWNQFFLQRPQLCHTYVSYAKQEGNSHFTTYFFPFALCRRIKSYIRPGLQSTWCVHVCGGGGYICVVMGSVCVDVWICVQLWMHVCMEVRDWHQPSCSLFCWDRFSDWTWSSQMQGSSYLPWQFWACKSLKLHLILHLGTRTGSHAYTSSLPRRASP